MGGGMEHAAARMFASCTSERKRKQTNKQTNPNYPPLATSIALGREWVAEAGFAKYSPALNCMLLFGSSHSPLPALSLSLSSSPCIYHCLGGGGEWGGGTRLVLSSLLWHTRLVSTEPVHFSGPHRTELAEHLPLVALGEPLRRQLVLPGVVPDVVGGARRCVLRLGLALLFPRPAFVWC